MASGSIYLAVNGDLVIDQRVHRTALTLMESGRRIVLVGRKRPGSPPLEERPYPVTRFSMIFHRGFMLYASFNLRLFVFLIFRKVHLLVSNDLDTLPACSLASRLKGITLVYDSHEYFTGLPELIGRSFIRNVWKWIERKTLPRLKHAITVSDSIAEAYRKVYGLEMGVVRNLPISGRSEPRRPDLLDCDPERVIIYQGALNIGRGLEDMISAMKYLEGFLFHIYGTGPAEGRLRSLVKKLSLDDRVEFMGRFPFRELRAFTRQASLGISLEEDRGLSYRFALPNKLFDYINALIPVLVSDLPEMREIVDGFGVGEVLVSREPEKLAGQIRQMMTDHEKRISWKKNLKTAAGELCWEKEAGKLRDIFIKAGLEFA